MKTQTKTKTKTKYAIQIVTSTTWLLRDDSAAIVTFDTFAEAKAEARQLLAQTRSDAAGGGAAATRTNSHKLAGMRRAAAAGVNFSFTPVETSDEVLS